MTGEEHQLLLILAETLIAELEHREPEALPYERAAKIRLVEAWNRAMEAQRALAEAWPDEVDDPALLPEDNAHPQGEDDVRF